MKLIIVESPTKAKTIENYAGKGFKVISSKGHIIDLPEKTIGINVEKNFEADFKPIPSKNKIIARIKEEAKKSDSIFIATDPDREGEAIAYHISLVIDKKEKEVSRVLFYEITKSGIEKGLSHPIKINKNLVESQYARRILDRLVGYMVSPFLWRAIKQGLSAGRVQSVALRLICEKEEKIELFKSKTTFKVRGYFNREEKNFFADLVEYDNSKAVFTEEKSAKEIEALLSKSIFKVETLKSEKKEVKPHPPFTTSTLQQTASNCLNFTAKRTMAIAQELYEGIKIDGEQTGLITYMRTDSTRINEDATKAIRSYIKENLSEKYISQNVNIFKTSANAQDAHEAIRVTDVELTPEKVEKFLSKDQQNLYSLIWKRTIACQMANSVYAYTTVNIRGDKFLFMGVGNQLLFDGFMKIYSFGDFRDLKNFIPNMNKNDEVELKSSEVRKEETHPPSRYTDATLIKALEAKGIGRPSTYAAIIDILMRRIYIIKEKRNFKPTDLGKIVNKVLVNYFSEIINVDFTAKMEGELDSVEQGKIKRADLLKEFYSEFSKSLKNAEINKKDVKTLVEEKTSIVCDKCGSPMIMKWGKYGKFLACSNYPKCLNTKRIEEENEKIDEKCPECSKPLVIKRGRFGKFIACSDYPKCKYTRNFTTGIKCPKCGEGELVERKSKKKRAFYGCSKYPKCDFATWNKIIKKKCSVCGYEGMEIIKDKYVCLKCKAHEKINQNEKSE
ncbi:MAG: DNA topoisomerase I [bacterium (Candidatus Stahlbacteria) CG23_combo_of_CG06-09_8_20_14_all_34_7]|nr:MAG: DNA topoisomerase I [bacterium (Candidatus Stahlbacteria) CG23_combo_of_CG06-09_8_20_14_all_34_7]